MAQPSPPAPPGRLDRAALAGVLVREIVNFSSYWRSTTFSSTVEPTIYLLAFGFGFGSLVSHGRRLRLRPVRRHRARSRPRCCSRRVFPAMFGTFVKYKFQRTYDAILAAPVDTEELVTAEALWIAVARRRLRLRADARGDGLRPGPELGHAARARSSRSSPASAGRASGSSIAARHEVDRQLQLRHRAPCITPLFLVAGHVLPDRRPARVGAGRWPAQPALPLRPARAPRRASAARLGRPLAPRRSSSVFGLAMWRLAVWRMRAKLID